jgi:hypothetical protein
MDSQDWSTFKISWFLRTSGWQKSSERSAGRVLGSGWARAEEWAPT